MKPGHQRIIRRLACLLALPLLLVATAAPAMAIPTAAATRYASPGGSQSGDCATWGSACDLQHALAVAADGDEILVKSGVYKPTGGTDRSLSFALKSGVAVYGGFDGSETSRDERAATGNVTTLSGAITGGGSYHVVTARNLSATAILDRFTITGGSADGIGAAGDGGGIRIDGGTPTLTSLLVTGNSARYNGGGIAIFGGAPLISNVTLSANQAGLVGGGLYSFNAAPKLTNATVSGNQAGIEGGGIAAQAGSPDLKNVTVSNNSAELEGEGLAALGSALVLNGSIVWGGDKGVIADYLVAATLSSSIVQGGCPTGATCSGIQSADPRLGSLGSYGGPTPTIPLSAGSPAVNVLVICLTSTDQRGVARPQGAKCDLGAYEQMALYTVTFDANGGTGTMPPQISDHSAGLATNGFIRSNHHFTGWNTQTNGSGSAYADGVIYDFAADMTLYAQWLEIPSATAATSLTFTGFTANWGAVSGASGYKLDLALDSGFTNYVNGYQNRDVGSGTSLVIGGLAPDSGYHYRVRAYIGSVTTDSSNIIDVAIPSGRVTSIAVDPAAAATLYAAIDGEGIHKSTDNGASWTKLANQPGNIRVNALLFHPTTSGTLYASTYGGGVYGSTDSGASWSACTGQPTNLNATALAIDPAGILYTGTEGGIFTSPDCSSWNAVNSGLTVDATKPPLVIVINGSTLYAGLDGLGVWKKVDTGDWTAASVGLPANSRVKTLVRKDSANLYAAVYGSGVYLSTDSGANWNSCIGQPTNINLLSLVIDGNGKLYAGTEAGVFVSSNGCGTWSPMNSGLPN